MKANGRRDFFADYVQAITAEVTDGGAVAGEATMDGVEVAGEETMDGEEDMDIIIMVKE